MMFPGKNRAIILGGKLHKDGGNPILTASGSKDVETEREELLLTHSQTQAINHFIKAYDRSKDKKDLAKLGEFVRDLILYNTVDQSGKYPSLK